MSDLPDGKKNELIRAFFPQTEVPNKERNLEDYEAYFNTFDTELNVLNTHRTYMELEFMASTDQLAEIALQAVPAMRNQPEITHDAILQVCRETPRHEYTNDHQSSLLLDEVEALKLAIDSVVRLWLMLDPSPRKGENDQEKNGWRGQRQLCEFVRTQFYPCQPASDGGRTQAETESRKRNLESDMMAETTQVQSNLTHPLTAANMKKLTNINIKWVSVLDEHLEFDADIRVLSVFPHNRWLFDAQSMIKAWKDESSQQKDKSPQQKLFLQKHNMLLFRFRLRSHGHAASKVRLREFTFYHDRLIELAQEFINPPKDWNTIFRDYRNPIQYWTFWLGLVLFIATIVSVALAGAQVYYAQHAAP
ncbi:hypothetical protein SNK04_007862 [Fusarium graminearum]